MSQHEDHGSDNKGASSWAQSWARWIRTCYGYCFEDGFSVFLCIPLIISLVLIAQRNTFDEAECRLREQSCGFEGNEDAYGLGIRLGVYLQWLATFLVSTVLHEEERPLMATSSVFSGALMVALLVLTFADGCTYAVEAIIMFSIILTTIALVMLTKTARGMYDLVEKHMTSTRSHSPSPMSPADRNNSFLISHSKGVRGWVSGTGTLELLITAYGCWFWVRMAVGTDTTFAQTPCGTSFFLLARVRSSGIPISSGFLAAFCFYLLIETFLGWVLRRIFSERHAEKIEQWMAMVILFPLTVLALIGYLAWELYEHPGNGNSSDSDSCSSTSSITDRALEM